MAGKLKKTKAAPIEIARITDEMRTTYKAALMEKVEPLDVKKAVALAKPAEEIELDLTELKEIKNIRSEWTSGAGLKRFEKLRDDLAILLEGGNRHFLDEHGVMWLAVRRQQKPLVIDKELLLEILTERGDQELLDKVMPRSVSIPAFRAAVATDRIDANTLVQVAEFGAKAPWVDFYPAKEDD